MSEELAQPQATQEPATPETTPATLKVKYNKEEKELTLDEAVPLVQKGMNYDHVYEELQTLRKDESKKILEELAQDYGVTPAEFLKKWKQDRDAEKARSLAEEKEIPQEVADELVQKDKTIKELKEYKETSETEAQRRVRIDREVKAFHEAFPGVKDEDVPDEVLEDFNNGMSLIKAYKAYQHDALKERVNKMDEQNKVQETNQSNADSSMGPARGTASSAPTKITLEWVNKLPQADYDRLPQTTKDEIWRLADKGELK